MATMTEGRTEVTEWRGLQVGDTFTLHGEQRKEYEFLGAVLDETGQCLHVNAVGGKIGRQLKTGSTRTHQMRALRPERVKIPSQRDLERQRCARELRAIER